MCETGQTGEGKRQKLEPRKSRIIKLGPNNILVIISIVKPKNGYYRCFFTKNDENRNSKYPTPFLGSEGRRFGKKLVHNFRSGFWESGIDVLLDG